MQGSPASAEAGLLSVQPILIQTYGITCSGGVALVADHTDPSSAN
jgi:hypothetical protein